MPLNRRVWQISGGILVIGLASFAAACLWLPGRILDRYERISATMGEKYRGNAERATLHLRGYSLHGVVVGRSDGAIETPLISVREVRVILDPWQRHASVVLYGLSLHLVATDDGAGQLGEGVAWRHFLDELAPGFAMQGVSANDAAAELLLPGLAHAPLPLDRFAFQLKGLSESPSDARPAPASIEANGRLLGHAAVELHGIFDPQGSMQRLNAEIRIDGIALPQLDPYARYWRGVDFEAGNASAVLRFTAQDGRARGRFVAHLRDIDVFDAKEDLGRDGDGLLHAARELFAAGGAAAMARDGRLDIEQVIEVRVELPDDNFDGLRGVLASVVISIEPG